MRELSVLVKCGSEGVRTPYVWY